MDLFTYSYNIEASSCGLKIVLLFACGYWEPLPPPGFEVLGLFVVVYAEVVAIDRENKGFFSAKIKKHVCAPFFLVFP